MSKANQKLQIRGMSGVLIVEPTSRMKIRKRRKNFGTLERHASTEEQQMGKVRASGGTEYASVSGLS
jgi:hypothetical protein